LKITPAPLLVNLTLVDCRHWGQGNQIECGSHCLNGCVAGTALNVRKAAAHQVAATQLNGSEKAGANLR
jgi:hypothetical protein